MRPRALEGAFEDVPDSSREEEAEVACEAQRPAAGGCRAVTVSFAESEGGVSLSLS